MSIRALDAAVTALDAHAMSLNVAANNIANVNTEEFDPSSVVLEERPDLGGVAVQEIREHDVQGPMVPAAGPMVEGGYVEGSGTDLVTETVSMISSQRAYEAAAVVVRTEDEMVGQFLDDVV